MDTRNVVILTGRLGSDADVKTIKLKTKDEERRVIEIRLATNKGKNIVDGKKVPDTEWHTCVGWGDRIVDGLQELKKGDKVQLNGWIKYEITDEGDDSRYFTKIIIEGYELMTMRSK